MFNPYFLMATLYAGLAVLGALDTSTTSYNLLPALSGLNWLRVHFITLGILTEVIFGLLTTYASRGTSSKPKTRWDIWVLLNTGLLVLLIGIPMINSTLIITGGTLIFIATALIFKLLMGAPSNKPNDNQLMRGRWFYLAGVSYLLVGIIVGTGLWLGWSTALHINVPIEVHVHANNWGFLSMVFAGLIVDFYPDFAGRALAWPRSIRPIFWLMLFGAFGLVIGPWFSLQSATVAGLLAHSAATLWLIANVVKPLVGDRLTRTVGIWHLVSSYVWQFAPVIFAPFVLLKVPGFPAATVELNAPQALIYGWVLQFGFAIIPYIFRRVLLHDEAATLGGNWLSLITIHLGGIFLWTSIFVPNSQSLLHGTAYALWLVALLPVVIELWHIIQKAINRLEHSSVDPAAAP